MGNKIAIRKLVKDILNTELVDPYPTDMTRPGTHFYDESDGINLSRGQTFPKGLVKINNSPGTELQSLGRKGHAKKYASIGIYYYVKEKTSYTEDEVTYKDKEFLHLMMDKIEKTLIDNRILEDYHLYPTSITATVDLPMIKDGNFAIHVGYRTITYYWSDTYGN